MFNDNYEYINDNCDAYDYVIFNDNCDDYDYINVDVDDLNNVNNTNVDCVLDDYIINKTM